jgi:hypothetical protein
MSGREYRLPVRYQPIQIDSKNQLNSYVPRHDMSYHRHSMTRESLSRVDGRGNKQNVHVTLVASNTLLVARPVNAKLTNSCVQ